jgi:hypothetical protein
MKYNVGDILELKKPHACGSHHWEVLRIGAEVRIKCVKCGRELMIFKPELAKKIKKVEIDSNIR